MEINFSKMPSRDAHDLLGNANIPRPIAWVSPVNAAGQVNLAPFSFFSGVTWNPPTLSFSVINRSDRRRKDTILNIEETALRSEEYERAVAYIRGITVEQFREKYKEVSIPLGRSGKLSEVADTVCFLASDRAGYIHGTVINVSGGKSRT